MFKNKSVLPIGTFVLVFVLLILAIAPANAQFGERIPILVFPPLNNDFANATDLVLNKRMVTLGRLNLADLELAEIFDSDLTSCNMYYSVWWRFVSPFSGELALSTAGSRAQAAVGVFTQNTRLAVYTGASLGTLAEVACNTYSSGSIAEIPSLSVSNGVTYYIRVGLNFSEPLSGGSLKLIGVIKDANDYDPVGMQNVYFSTPIGTHWIMKKAFNGDGRVCTPNCWFKFVGGVGEATKLKQAQVWPVNELMARKMHMLDMSIFVSAFGAPNLKIVLKVSYSDGTPASKDMLYVTDTGARSYRLGVFFESPNVKKVKVVLTNLSLSGTTYVDSLYLDYDGGMLRDAPLPLPSAPR